MVSVVSLTVPPGSLRVISLEPDDPLTGCRIRRVVVVYIVVRSWSHSLWLSTHLTWQIASALSQR